MNKISSLPPGEPAAVLLTDTPLGLFDRETSPVTEVRGQATNGEAPDVGPTGFERGGGPRYGPKGFTTGQH